MDRTAAARDAALRRWARIGTTERRIATEPARRGLLAKYESIVDPEEVLQPGERAEMARRALRAFLVQQSYVSARVRREQSLARRRAEVDQADEDPADAL